MRALWLVVLMGCWSGEPSSGKDETLLVVGDSILAWNRPNGWSVAQLVEAQVDLRVTDVSVPGAQFLFGKGAIREQAPDGDWDWVVLDGGGNDLNRGCACGPCEGVLQVLISEDGQTGAFPEFVDALTAGGSKVVVYGYMGLPDGVSYGFTTCGGAMAELTRRFEKMSAARRQVWVVDGRQLYDGTDLSYFDHDQLHPSQKGSKAIADAVAEVVRSNL